MLFFVMSSIHVLAPVYKSYMGMGYTLHSISSISRAGLNFFSAPRRNRYEKIYLGFLGETRIFYLDILGEK